MSDYDEPLTREERIAQLDAELYKSIDSFDPFAELHEASHTLSFNTQTATGVDANASETYTTSIYDPENMVEHNGKMGLWSDGVFFEYDPGTADHAAGNTPAESIEQVRTFMDGTGYYDAANDAFKNFGEMGTSLMEAIQSLLKTFQEELGIEQNGQWNAETRAAVLANSDQLRSFQGDNAQLAGALVENFADNMDNLQQTDVLASQYNSNLSGLNDESITPMVHMGGGSNNQEAHQTWVYDPDRMVTVDGKQGYMTDGVFIEFSEELHEENQLLEDEMAVGSVQDYLIDYQVEPLASNMEHGTGAWTAATTQSLKQFIIDKQTEYGLTQNGEWSPLLSAKLSQEVSQLKDSGIDGDYDQSWKLDNLIFGLNRLHERGKLDGVYNPDSTQSVAITSDKQAQITLDG